ncbi:MAG: low-specificity L-threonine aldolase [Anaerolineae bacterium]|nr:low-specificity L-threonine aldolase [Anaerolineae bacterium]
MDKIDLRSDTVAWPTPAMRQAMANAEVGDDVFGDDPTVNRLQAMAAERMGMEAGLFVSSGTQGNLVAILSHCTRGDEVILGDKAHTFNYEAGGIAALGGVHPRTVPVQPDGTLRLDDIRRAVRPPDVHFAPPRLLCLENTQGSLGGMPVGAAYTRSAAALAHELGLKVHVDGARIFNAAAALGCAARDLVDGVDSVTFCLSKGLCAPVGAVLCGSAAFIEQARRIRKIVGGGMRQAGVLAAAGIVALEVMAGRLAEDHANARRLAEGLMQIDGVVLDIEQVQTNMVMFTLSDDCPLAPAHISARLAEHDIVTLPRLPFRLVTHYWITPERVERVIEAFREIFAAG